MSIDEAFQMLIIQYTRLRNGIRCVWTYNSVDVKGPHGVFTCRSIYWCDRFYAVLLAMDINETLFDETETF